MKNKLHFSWQLLGSRWALLLVLAGLNPAAFGKALNSKPNHGTGGPLNTGLQGGTHGDRRANLATAYAFLTTAMLPPPTLTSLSPGSGPVGSSVELTGSDFSGTVAVSFNGTNAPGFVVNSPTSITVGVPAGATNGDVTVTSPDGTSNGLSFSVTTPLAIASTSPAANARSASAGGPVTVAFNQTVTAGSAAALKVFSNQRGGLRSTTSGSTTASGNTVAFAPSYAFKAGETVQATVTTAAAAAAAGNLPAARVLQFTAATTGGSGIFSSGSTVSLAGASQHVVVGDVDGDGDLDFVTSNTSNSTMSVGLNDGNGTFSNNYTISGGSRPESVVLGDVDGDGDLDFLTANRGSNTVRVNLNNGSGTFSGGSNVAVGTSPLCVVLGDVDGDGDLDFVASSDDNTVNVRLNNGNGVFSGGSDVGVARGRHYSVVLGDVDGDGDLDLLVTNDYDFVVSVRLNNGNGTFSGGSDVVVNALTINVVLGDVDGDGDLDFITGGHSVNVRLNNGNGTFSSAPNLPYSSAVGQIYSVLGDLDGDGDLDFIAPNSFSNHVIVLLNNGSGVFSSGSSLNAGGPPLELALGDVDGDGDLDFLTANFSRLNVRLNQNRSTVITLGSLSPNFGSVGTSITLTGTNFTSATAVGFSNNRTNAPGFVVNSTTSITVSVPAGATNGDVTVTAPDGNSNGIFFTVTLPNLVINTPNQNIAAGTYNSITVANGGEGTLQGNVVVNSAVAVQDGGTLRTNCQSLTGAATFTLAAGGTLAVCDPAGISASENLGAVRTTGTRSFSPDASYVYNGTGAQATGTGLPAQVRNLTASSAAPLTQSQGTSVAHVLTLNTPLVTGGNPLTLLSTGTGSAVVVNNGAATNVVMGTATVQRYIDPSLNPGLGYHHYAAPVSGSTVADLATAGFTPQISQGDVYNTSATPNLVTPFPTVFAYDQNRVALTNSYAPFDRGFVVPSASNPQIDLNLTVGRGYAVNIGGTQLVDFTGTLFTGDRTLALARNAAGSANAAEAGYHLVGNPYPAPLDYSLVAPADRTGLDAAIYIYSSTSQYAGSYRAYVNGVGGNPVLPVAQGFFVRVSTGQTNATVNFRNSQRLTAPDATPFQRNAADARPLVQLELRGTAGPADTFYAYAEAGATPAFDAQYDAAKRPNTTGLNLASVAGTEALAIDGRPTFTAGTTLVLTVGVPAAGTYTLSATALQNLPANLDAFLTDAATGRTVNLALQPAYALSVNAAEAATAITGRFTLHFGARTALATASPLSAGVSLYPNPAHASFAVTVPAVAGATQVQATLLNTLGQAVYTRTSALPAAGTLLTVETGGLAAGVYTLQVRAGAATVAKRVVVQ